MQSKSVVEQNKSIKRACQEWKQNKGCLSIYHDFLLKLLHGSDSDYAKIILAATPFAIAETCGETEALIAEFQSVDQVRRLYVKWANLWNWVDYDVGYMAAIEAMPARQDGTQDEAEVIFEIYLLLLNLLFARFRQEIKEIPEKEHKLIGGMENWMRKGFVRVLKNFAKSPISLAKRAKFCKKASKLFAKFVLLRLLKEEPGKMDDAGKAIRAYRDVIEANFGEVSDEEHYFLLQVMR